MDLVIRILPWALPPLVGAAIGYITNAIAIAMLFRPYTEKRFLGIKVPMTPGIIPKQRYELSGNIGRLVSGELLTEDAVRSQIESPKFMEGVLEAFKKFSEKLFTTKLKDLKGAFSKGFTIPKKDRQVIQSIITDLLNRFLTSGGIVIIIRGFISRGIRYLENVSPGTLLSKRFDLVEGVIRQLLSPENGRRLKDKLRRMLEEGIHDNRKISEFLSPEKAELLGRAGLKIYDLLFPEFIRWLNENSTRAELEIRGVFILRDIFEKLNRVQRFLLSAAQYDKTLEENIGSIIDDLVANLKETGTDPDTKERIYSAAVSGLKRFSSLSLGEVVLSWKGNFWDDFDKAGDEVLSFIFCNDFADGTARRLKRFIEGNGDLTIGELLYSRLGVSRDFMRNELPEIAVPDLEFLRKLFSGAADDLSFAEESLSSLLNLDPDSMEKFYPVGTDLFLELLSGKIPDILKSVDVQSLVVQKIDSLEIEKIEELILVIVKKQLRWINIFGALLGSLIGGVQLALNLSMR